MAGKLALRIGKRRIPLWLWGPVALAALAVGGYFGLWQPLRKYIFPTNWGVVEEGRIYRSGLMKPNLVKRTLAEHNIRVIVALNGREADDPDQMAQEEAAKELNIEILRFPMRGNGTPGDANAADGLRKYAGALAAVVKARRESKPVLIQCGAGTHRTGGIVATYRVLVEKRPPSEAYAELRRYGWDPDKHQDLLKFLNPNMAELSKIMVEMGVIDRVPNPVPVIGP